MFYFPHGGDNQRDPRAHTGAPEDSVDDVDVFRFTATSDIAMVGAYASDWEFDSIPEVNLFDANGEEVRAQIVVGDEGAEVAAVEPAAVLVVVREAHIVAPPAALAARRRRRRTPVGRCLGRISRPHRSPPSRTCSSCSASAAFAHAEVNLEERALVAPIRAPHQRAASVGHSDGDGDSEGSSDDGYDSDDKMTATKLRTTTKRSLHDFCTFPAKPG